MLSTPRREEGSQRQHRWLGCVVTSSCSLSFLGFSMGLRNLTVSFFFFFVFFLLTPE
jgi:hypothetical protein